MEDKNDVTVIETLYFNVLTDKSARQPKQKPIINLTVALKLVTMNFIHTITEAKPIDILDE